MTDSWLAINTYAHTDADKCPFDTISVFEEAVRERDFVIITTFRGIW